jgi:pyruvate-formate lyase-activating enzyme
MPSYVMVYGDDEQVVRETFDDVRIEREDGRTVVFRGNEAILRVSDDHVQSLERI